MCAISEIPLIHSLPPLTPSSHPSHTLPLPLTSKTRKWRIFSSGVYSLSDNQTQQVFQTQPFPNSICFSNLKNNNPFRVRKYIFIYYFQKSTMRSLLFKVPSTSNNCCYSTFVNLILVLKKKFILFSYAHKHICVINYTTFFLLFII